MNLNQLLLNYAWKSSTHFSDISFTLKCIKPVGSHQRRSGRFSTKTIHPEFQNVPQTREDSGKWERMLLTPEAESKSTKQSCDTLSHRFQWQFARLKDLPQNSNRQTGLCFGYFQGEIDHPPVSLGFHKKNHLKTSKTCGVVTAMVFKPLLWCSDASITQLDWRLVSEQKQIDYSVYF